MFKTFVLLLSGHVSYYLIQHLKLELQNYLFFKISTFPHCIERLQLSLF